MDTFQGESFHTSRWNYDVDLAGKRVGIIGTGATAVQAIPELAKVVGELYVFQRTPSTIDVRAQRETTPTRSKPGRTSPVGPGPPERFAAMSSVRDAVKAPDEYMSGRVSEYRKREKLDRAPVARRVDPEAPRRELRRDGGESGPGSMPSSRTP